MPSLTSYPTSTLAPSFTPLPSNTHIPTRTQTPKITNTPTATPWPLKYAKKRLLEFYKTNGNCRLPCWWGITPGETTYDEMKTLFAPYAETIELDEDYLPEMVFFYYPSPSNSIDYFISSTLSLDENGGIESIGLDPETGLYNGFTPSNLLGYYGTPNKVLISPSDVVLVYEEDHFVVFYEILEHADKNQVCFFYPGSIILWSAEGDLTPAEVKQRTTGTDMLPWEEFTNQNIQTLFNALKAWNGTEKEYCFSIN
jgi:hypothetical protein